jgi:hypothetical protein
MEQVATVVRPLGPDVMVSYSSKDVPLEKESRDGVGIAAWGIGELASLLFPLRGSLLSTLTPGPSPWAVFFRGFAAENSQIVFVG